MNPCRALLLALLLPLAACGFHLRGHDQHHLEFPFHTLYLKASQDTQFLADLRHHLVLNHLELASDPASAQVILEIQSERADKQIQSLSGVGRVREYLLRYGVTLKLYDTQQRTWLRSGEISASRIMTYDDTQLLAKEQEEALLYRDMRLDVVQQLLRRLSHARPMVEQP